MINAKGFASKVSYRTPGEKIDLPNAPAVTFYVLGPPKDEQSLKKTNSTTEVYHLGLESLSTAVMAASGFDPDGSGNDPYPPSTAPTHASWTASAAAKATTRGRLHSRHVHRSPEADP